jgi:putative membrane protein
MKNLLIVREMKNIVKNPKILIPIIAILFIPIMYSGMFIYAFWDPYGKVENLPVAVVNHDKGATFEKEKLHLGSDLVDKLKEKKKLDFHFVSEKSAKKGLADQKYYLLVEIPSDFSKNATTLMDENPKKLQLDYVPNESSNFLSAKIGDSALKEIQFSLSKAVTETYSETMFDKMKEMGRGYTQASDGAKRLEDGAGKLAGGADELKANLEKLASKSVELGGGVTKVKDGSDHLATGTNQLSSGLGQLYDANGQLIDGVTKLKSGTDQLANGLAQSATGLNTANQSMGQIVSGTSQIKEGASTLAQKLGDANAGAASLQKGAQSLNQGLTQLQNQLAPVLASVPEEKRAQIEAAFIQLQQGSGALESGSGDLANGAQSLHAGANQLAAKIGELNAGQVKIQDGLGQLTTGSTQLLSGATKLQSGQNDLFAGMNQFHQKLGDTKSGSQDLAKGASNLQQGMFQLSSGSQQLSSGTGKLATGSGGLASGTKELENGTTELHSKLGSAAEKAGKIKADDKTYNMMGDPVQLNKNAIHPVSNYGTGIAPYFLSLGLFVGALLLTIVFPLIDPIVRPRNGVIWFFTKYVQLAIIGVLQSLIVVAILLYGLDLQVESVSHFILFTIVTSLTYMALIQLLVTTMGNPGRFLAIMILILQLTTSAGTFPLEMLPSSIQPLHKWLPMSYSLDGFKAVISSGDLSFMWMNVWVLLTYMVAFMMITLTYFVIVHRRRYGPIDSVEVQ